MISKKKVNNNLTKKNKFIAPPDQSTSHHSCAQRIHDIASPEPIHIKLFAFCMLYMNIYVDRDIARMYI